MREFLFGFCLPTSSPLVETIRRPVLDPPTEEAFVGSRPRMRRAVTAVLSCCRDREEVHRACASCSGGSVSSSKSTKRTILDCSGGGGGGECEEGGDDAQRGSG